MSSQDISISAQTDLKSQQTASEGKHDISVGSDGPVKQIISLKDISLTDRVGKEEGLTSSRLFEKQIKQQKSNMPF